MNKQTMEQANQNVKLVIVRHGQSLWNKENRFTGWADVPLTEQGFIEARDAGQKIKALGLDFTRAYCSVLTRSIHTLWEILKETDLNWLPVVKDYRLNERHYGALTGLNKKETADEYGADQVHKWRRGFDTIPPLLEMDDERHPLFDRRYQDMLPASELPGGESLKITLERFMPLWRKTIQAELKEGKNLLVVAHGNSLRALMLDLEGLSPEDITSVEISTGVPICYTLDMNMNVISKEVL